MQIRIVLIAEEGNARQTYLAELESIGIQIDVISSLGDIHRLMGNNYYNGVLLDFKTKMKATAYEKEITLDLLEQFPFAQINLEEKTGIVKVLCYDQIDKNRTLKDFININCRSFNARLIRLHERKENHFNIILSKTSNFSEQEIDHTVTIDISKGGCFIYSTANWKINTNVLIIINELNDKRPILCVVKRIVSWGEAMQIPGIGIEFNDISENQLEEFCSIGNI